MIIIARLLFVLVIYSVLRTIINTTITIKNRKYGIRFWFSKFVRIHNVEDDK